MNNYEPFHYSSTRYELAHLNTFYTKFTQPAKNNRSEKIYHCLIEFSHHCFTKNPNTHKGESLRDYPTELHYTTDKETRIFCFERYELSKQLPQIIKAMDKQKCFLPLQMINFLPFLYKQKIIRKQTTKSIFH